MAAITTTVISNVNAQALLERLKKGEAVRVEERFSVIRQILSFSSRDWSSDPELWLLYKVAMNDGSQDDV